MVNKEADEEDIEAQPSQPKKVVAKWLGTTGRARLEMGDDLVQAFDNHNPSYLEDAGSDAGINV